MSNRLCPFKKDRERASTKETGEERKREREHTKRGSERKRARESEHASK